jgi:hypothetical protein
MTRYEILLGKKISCQYWVVHIGSKMLIDGPYDSPDIDFSKIRLTPDFEDYRSGFSIMKASDPRISDYNGPYDLITEGYVY